MNAIFLTIAAFCSTALWCVAGVRIDEEAFAKNLGGWSKRDKRAAEYQLSGASYRTYKPEISPTPDGGIFVSVRIDHVRGWLSSDDHAILEITVSPDGQIVSAQSTIAIQGRSISSDVIVGGAKAGGEIIGAERTVRIGAELVADLSAKLLREKIVEAGRVSFPAALRHNYNLLFQSIRVGEPPAPEPPRAEPASVETPAPVSDQLAAPEAPAQEPAAPAPAPAEKKTAAPAPSDPTGGLEIKPFGTPKPPELKNKS